MNIYLGYDRREHEAWEVAAASIREHSRGSFRIVQLGIDIDAEWVERIYTRATGWSDGRRWDVISGAPMSTGHAIVRFFVPYLQDYRGWALFMDSDILCRADIRGLMHLADPAYAVQVVKHGYQPRPGIKKDNQLQTLYHRKNWSSVMLWNCAHPSNKKLTLELLNSAPGRDLHRFCWLDDSEIGSLPERWNWLVNHSSCDLDDPAIVHFTEGLPNVLDHDADPFSDEWFAARDKNNVCPAT